MEMIKNYRSLRCQENSPYEHLRKWIENSMENVHNDVKGVKG